MNSVKVHFEHFIKFYAWDFFFALFIFFLVLVDFKIWNVFSIQILLIQASNFLGGLKYLILLNSLQIFQVL